MTLESFAQDVGVTKSAVSLWISATRKIAVKPATLRRVAKRTGAHLDDLERMTYANTAGDERNETTGIYLTADELEALLERASEKVVRRLLEERGEGHAE